MPRADAFTKTLNWTFENFLPLLPLLHIFQKHIRKTCFSCCFVRDHLKPNLSRNVPGSWRIVIRIISQRRTELNYQHGCVQTRAQLITLGWSPCCLCPRTARSQLTTWRFIAGAAQLSTMKLSSSTVQFLTLSTWEFEIMEQTLRTFRYPSLKSLVHHLSQSVYTSLCYFNSFPCKDVWFFRWSSSSVVPFSVVSP